MLKPYWAKLHTVAGMKTVRMTMMLFAAQILLALLGFAIKGIQTRGLGPEDFGTYSFFISTVTFLALFFHFGVFSSTQVLLSENHSKTQEKRLLGAGFIYFLGCSILFIFFILLVSQVIDYIYGTSVGPLFLRFSFLTPLIMFRWYVNGAAIGTGKVLQLPIFENISKLFFLLSLVFIWLQGDFSVDLVILLNLLTILLAAFIALLWFRPSFQDLGSTLMLTYKKTKEHGFHLFIGNTLQQSTYKMDEMMIPFFVGTTKLGFYSLGVAMIAPVVMMSQGASKVLFRSMASNNQITRRHMRLNFLWSAGAVFLIGVNVWWVVPLLFGPGYEETIWITWILLVAAFFHSLMQPYTFLAAKSQGLRVRNIMTTATLVNLAGNFALIPFFGVMGAALASVVSRVVNLWLFRIHYRRYLSENPPV